MKIMNIFLMSCYQCNKHKRWVVLMVQFIFRNEKNYIYHFLPLWSFHILSGEEK